MSVALRNEVLAGHFNKSMDKAMRHYEESAFISVAPETLFAYVDDHSRFSSHMTQSSWMIGGGRMDVQVTRARVKLLVRTFV